MRLPSVTIHPEKGYLGMKMLTPMKLVVLAMLASLGFGAVAQASLVGTQVTGTLQFNGGGLNDFDPANGGVPAGYLNSAGPTVVISSTATEFAFQNAADTVTIIADFGEQTLFQFKIASTDTTSQHYTFTDNAFVGQTLTLSNDTFSGLTYSLVGNKITIDVPLSFNGGISNAQFILTPEPASLASASAASASSPAVVGRKPVKRTTTLGTPSASPRISICRLIGSDGRTTRWIQDHVHCSGSRGSVRHCSPPGRSPSAASINRLRSPTMRRSFGPEFLLRSSVCT